MARSPSALSEDLMSSKSVPWGKRNSLLYSLKMRLLSSVSYRSGVHLEPVIEGPHEDLLGRTGRQIKAQSEHLSARLGLRRMIVDDERRAGQLAKKLLRLALIKNRLAPASAIGHLLVLCPSSAAVLSLVILILVVFVVMVVVVVDDELRKEINCDLKRAIASSILRISSKLSRIEWNSLSMRSWAERKTGTFRPSAIFDHDQFYRALEAGGSSGWPLPDG